MPQTTTTQSRPQTLETNGDRVRQGAPVLTPEGDVAGAYRQLLGAWANLVTTMTATTTGAVIRTALMPVIMARSARQAVRGEITD